jgi:hypothetical protein
MPENKNRFVLLCRQVLALGTVAAIVVPAAGVVSLNIVAPVPAPTGRPAEQAASQPTREGGASPLAMVASAPVEPEVREVPLDGVDQAGLRALPRRAAARVKADEDVAVLSAPTEVDGLATVGVTWSHRDHLAEDEVTVSVRSLDQGRWSPWQPVEYHDDHGPDPGSEEARRARPGTDPIVVGDVDKVQVKVETTDGEAPADAKLAVVDPEATPEPKLEAPAIDTARLPEEDSLALSAATVPPAADDTGTTGDPGTTDAAPAVDAGTGAADEAVLSGGVGVTPKPKIFARAQWGADESLRDKSSLRYYEVHAGFVHHTVNANGYTRAQVPALIRGIYAYHTKAKGWSDIGYNFIVDRFGRIWEGRYGGVDRPVVGAHTLNYNEYSFAMSALGNFEQAQPSSAMLDAYGRLFAWKLSLHGVAASSTKQWVRSRYFRAINGHRDAGQTACPGKYLYNKLDTIRALAAKYQAPFTERARTTDVAGSPWPDLVVRDKATQKAFVVRTGGQTDFEPGRRALTGWKGMDLVAAAHDLTGDGVPDLIARNAATLMTGVFPGTPQGGFGAPVLTTKRFAAADQLTGVLDLTGDGKNDLVARAGTAKSLWLYPGNGRGGFGKRIRLAADWSSYNRTVGVGDLNGDGRNDLLVRRAGRVYLVPGVGRRIGTPTPLARGWGQFNLIAGAGDLTNDGLPDVVVKNARTKLVSIFPGNGAGRLDAPLGPFRQFKNLNYIAAVGQLAGNAGTDLIGRDGRGALFVFANNGARNIEAVTDTGTELRGTNLILNVGDWNGDGFGDVITRAAKTGNLYLRPGDGKGRFGAPVLAATGWGRVGLVAAVGDITGDGHPDLMGQPAGTAMRIYPGDGAAGFLPSYVAHSASARTRTPASACGTATGRRTACSAGATARCSCTRATGPAA